MIMFWIAMNELVKKASPVIEKYLVTSGTEIR